MFSDPKRTIFYKCQGHILGTHVNMGNSVHDHEDLPSSLKCRREWSFVPRWEVTGLSVHRNDRSPSSDVRHGTALSPHSAALRPQPRDAERPGRCRRCVSSPARGGCHPLHGVGGCQPLRLSSSFLERRSTCPAERCLEPQNAAKCPHLDPAEL